MARASIAGESENADTARDQDGISISTLSRLLQVPSRIFDNVFIDEAGAIALPLVYAAACLARKRVVVSGDPSQLPPIFSYNGTVSKTTRILFRSHAFRGVRIRLHDHGRPDKRLQVLSVQHRMCDTLAELVRLSGLYLRYETGAARSVAPEEKAVAACHPLPGEPYVVVDTSGSNARFLHKQAET
jgi:hypothetical protein